MSVLFSKSEGILVAIPDGRLDTSNAAEAEQQIVEQIEAGEGKIAVDFSKTNYISSAGLRIILKAAKLLKQKGGSIVLCNANEQIHEVLEISGFLTMLNCTDSLDEAVQALSS
jgi:anti-anti-sigma factor